MELIGTAERGVVLKKLNRTQKTKGKPLPYSPLLSNLDSNVMKEGWPCQQEKGPLPKWRGRGGRLQVTLRNAF